MYSARRTALLEQLKPDETALLEHCEQQTAGQIAEEYYPINALEYRPISNLLSFHWGQRKLLMIEIEFLTLAKQRGFTGRDVLYLGAADGLHIAHLAQLFPELRFDCWDERPFNRALHDRINITLNPMNFESDHTALYRDISEFVLISDVRIDPKLGHHHDDLDWQFDIASELHPFASSLKFYRPRTEEHQKIWFDGSVRYQPWAAETSNETRMFVWDHTRLAAWDMQRYDQTLFYHNLITRNARRSSPLDVPIHPTVDRSHDMQREISIWHKYLAMRDPSSLVIDPTHLINDASSALHKSFSDKLYTVRSHDLVLFE